jgi:hypothetical protein
MMKESAMWIVKGTFLGISAFAVGVVVFLFLLAFFRNQGPLLAGPGQQRAIGLTVISHLTVYNVWFWAAFAACLVIGWAIAASWPGRFSPAFWVVLALIDLLPAGLLGLVLLLVSRLKEAAAAATK